MDRFGISPWARDIPRREKPGGGSREVPPWEIRHWEGGILALSCARAFLEPHLAVRRVRVASLGREV